MSKIAREIAIDLAPPINEETATEIPDVAKATEMVDKHLAPTLALMERLVEGLEKARDTFANMESGFHILKEDTLSETCRVAKDGTIKYIDDYKAYLKERG